MKSLFKKAVPFVLIFSSVAIAAGLITKEEVNKKVSALVAPYNNATTKLELSFTDLNVDAVRALDFGVNALVNKKGSNNELTLVLQNASYHYGNGSAPTVQGQLSFQLDLVKALGQENVNQYGGSLDELAKSLVAEYGQKYGAAAVLDIAMEDMQKDAAGNFVSAKLRANAVIDFNQLPANMKPEDVELKEVQASIAISKGGAAINLKLTLNPLYKGFSADQPGLKELIEKLLNEDKATYDSVGQLLKMLDGIATYLVEMKPEPVQP